MWIKTLIGRSLYWYPQLVWNLWERDLPQSLFDHLLNDKNYRLIKKKPTTNDGNWNHKIVKMIIWDCHPLRVNGGNLLLWQICFPQMLSLQPLIFHPPKNVFLRMRYHISHKISLSLAVIFGVRAGYWVARFPDPLTFFQKWVGEPG